VRSLSNTPLARGYDDRFASFAPPSSIARDFTVHQLRATTVLRWEYAPGSTLFVVWSDASDVRPANTLTIKASYRFAP
jgi:hypothetical protein